MPKKQLNFPLILLVIGLVLILGAITWYVFMNAPSRPTQLPAEPTQAHLPYPDIPRIRLSDAKAAYELKTAVFVDVRTERSYAQGHIPGALSIPSGDIAARSGELKAQDWIILYCT